jgi:4-amino-4-deoxy-L-arabinose transferase-like glycosyltransferase
MVARGSYEDRPMSNMRPQIYLLPVAVFLSVLASMTAGDGMTMRYPLLSVASWLLAVVLVVAAVGGSGPSEQGSTWTGRDTSIAIALILIAAPLRVVSLDRIPWLLTGDEGSVGLVALEFQEGTRDNIFGVSWFSFPSLFFLLPRVSIELFGRTIFALRLPSAIAGIATIPVLYWASRTMFGRTVALISSVYLATFHFHIHFSRLAINNAWDALFITLFMGFFWRAWTSGSRSYFVTAGLTLGLAQFFYVSSRALIAIVPIWLLLAAIRDLALLRKRLPGLGYMLVAATVISLPLALFFVRHPGEFFAPFNRVLILGEPLRQEALRIGDPQWLLLWDQLRYTILGFFSAPFRLWYTGASMLLPVSAILFLMGLLLSLKRFRDLRFAWLCLLLLSALVASTVTDYVPSAQRFVHIAPTVAVLVSLPIAKLYAVARLSQLRVKRILPVLGAVVLLVVAANDAYFYFAKYSPGHRFGDIETEVANAIVEQVTATSPLGRAYLFGLPRMGFATHASMRYILGDHIGLDVASQVEGEYSLDFSGPTLYLFLPERVGELEQIADTYPGGTRKDVYGNTGELLFVSYYVGG